MVVPGSGGAHEDQVDDLLQVHGVVERLPELHVPQCGVTLAGALVAVEGQLVEAVGDDVAGGDARLALELLDLRRDQVAGAVDVAGLEVLQHGVAVGVVREVDLVDLGLRAPPAGVGDEMDVVVLLPLHAREGAGAHVGRGVRIALPRLLGRDLRPDVLGQDGQPVADHVRLGLGAHELHRVVVDRGRLLDEVGVRGVVRHLVLDDVVVGEGDVLGGERHAVVPLGVLAEGERPDETVVAHRPVGGQTGRLLALHRRERLGVVADERVVAEVPHLERRRLVADERVEVVGLPGPADLVDDLAGIGRRGRRRALARAGRLHGPREPEHGHSRHHEQD